MIVTPQDWFFAYTISGVLALVAWRVWWVAQYWQEERRIYNLQTTPEYWE